MSEFENTQKEIDAMFERPDGPRASERILSLAKRGLEAPESLLHKELQQICYALVAHYASMGIH